MKAPPAPPRLATRLVEWLAVDLESTHVLGDLQEGFADRSEQAGRASAQLWYWRQAFLLAVGLGGPRLLLALSPESLLRDVHLALRSFRRTPGLLVAGILTLGIGIGGPATMFGIVDGMFSQLPVERSQEVVSLRLVDPVRGGGVAVTWPVFDAWQTSSSNLAEVGAYLRDGVAVSGSDISPTRANAAKVTPEVMELLRVRPVIGRVFGAADKSPGEPLTAIIREDRWEDWFDRSTSALGAQLRINGVEHTVIGVVPSAFGFPENHEIWTIFRPELEPEAGLQVVGRLRTGTALETARVELDGIVRTLANSGVEAADGSRAYVDEYVLAMNGRGTRTMLRYLSLVVSFLVVIAAANVAALFLARGSSRTAETAVRLAIGAGRARIARQVVIEALVLATGGAVLGLTITRTATGSFGGTLEARGSLPYWAEFGLTPSVLIFAALLLCAATIVAGVLPAIRTSRVDLSHAMKSGTGADAKMKGGLLSFVVGAEVTMSCVLLILSGLVVKGALGTVQLVGAFPIDDVLTGRFVLESYDYETVEHRSRFYDALVRSLEEDPDVEAFTLGSGMPGDGTSRTRVGLEGVIYEREQDWPLIQRRIVGPHFFEMFDMALLAGRVFGSGDRLEQPLVVMVNEAFARQQLPDGYVVGRRLMIQLDEGDPIAHEIVGLVTDPGVSVDDGRRVAAVFLPLAQSAPEVSLLAVRARGGFEKAREIMIRDMRALDADLPLAPITTLEAIVRRENDGGRLFGSLFGAFGLSALILAIVGLHGVVSFTTQQRTREIGVMRALGAQQRGVLVSTITRGLRPVVVGVVLGTALALLLGPLMGEGLFGTDPRDPWVLTLVPLTLLLGAAGAALLPALRASRIDPVTALRAE